MVDDSFCNCNTHCVAHLHVIYPNIKKSFNKQCSPQGLEINSDQNSNATIIIKGAPSSSHVVAWMNGQAYQEVGY